MVRPLRIEYENAYYHVMNRGRGRQIVFPGDEFYRAFLSCLEEASKRFGVEVQCYCLMGNHYHLLLKTPRANLSRALRHIDGVYTQRHNRLKRTDGSLFRGRYKAIVVDASSYLLQVSRYIHRNPIETKSPLVAKLEDYPWSSYPAFINRAKAPAWLNRDSVYGELASTRRYQAYAAYVEQGNDEETGDFYSRKRGLAVLGDDEFKQSVFAHAVALDEEVDTSSLKEPVPVERIVKAVADYYQVSPGRLYRAKRGAGSKNIPRWIAMKLSQELADARLLDLARIFNVGHYSTISRTIARLNQLLERESKVGRDLNVLSQDLTPRLLTPKVGVPDCFCTSKKSRQSSARRSRKTKRSRPA